MASPRQRHSPAVRQRGRLRLGIAVAHTDNKPAALVVVPGSGFEEPVACTYRWTVTPLKLWVPESRACHGSLSGFLKAKRSPYLELHITVPHPLKPAGTPLILRSGRRQRHLPNFLARQGILSFRKPCLWFLRPPEA